MTEPPWTRLLGLLITLSLAMTLVTLAPAAHSDPLSESASISAVAQEQADSERGPRWRAVKFNSGTRKYRMVRHELKLRPRLSHSLPRCQHYTMRIYEKGAGAITSCTSSTREADQRWDWDWIADEGFWSTAWKVTLCVASVVAVVAPLVKAARYVKDLGGMREAAELIVKAGSWSDLQDAAPYLAAEILGLSAIENNCF